MIKIFLPFPEASLSKHCMFVLTEHLLMSLSSLTYQDHLLVIGRSISSGQESVVLKAICFASALPTMLLTLGQPCYTLGFHLALPASPSELFSSSLLVFMVQDISLERSRVLWSYGWRSNYGS